jgi:hypothetical protein
VQKVQVYQAFYCPPNVDRKNFDVKIHKMNRLGQFDSVRKNHTKTSNADTNCP